MRAAVAVASPVVAFLIALGFEVSGVESMVASLVLWILAVGIALVFVIPKTRAWTFRKLGLPNDDSDLGAAGQRVGIRNPRGKTDLKTTSISGMDVAIDATDGDLNAEDLTIKAEDDEPPKEPE